MSKHGTSAACFCAFRRGRHGSLLVFKARAAYQFHVCACSCPSQFGSVFHFFRVLRCIICVLLWTAVLFEGLVLFLSEGSRSSLRFSFPPSRVVGVLLTLRAPGVLCSAQCFFSPAFCGVLFAFCCGPPRFLRDWFSSCLMAFIPPSGFLSHLR